MKNLHLVLWVIDQNHVCDLSIWVFPSSLMALSVRLCFPFALRLAAFASWFFLFPLGSWAFLTGGLLPCLADPVGVTASRICEIRAGRVPSLLRGGPVSSHTEASPVCLREGVLVPSLFSRHHRLCHPRSDDLLLTQPHQGFTRVHPSALHLARFRFVAKLPLGHYSWLHTLLLPGTHAGIGDRLGHEPGGVLLLPTHDMRFAHRTMSSKNITSCNLKNTTGSMDGRPPAA